MWSEKHPENLIRSWICFLYIYIYIFFSHLPQNTFKQHAGWGLAGNPPRKCWGYSHCRLYELKFCLDLYKS